MADEADKADAFVEGFTRHGLVMAKQSRFPGLKATGYCRWCGDQVNGDRLHCQPIDNGCEEDHAKFNQQKGAGGANHGPY